LFVPCIMLLNVGYIVGKGELFMRIFVTF